MMITVINGANLNLLGKRDPNEYGSFTLNEIENELRKEFPDLLFDFFQSNVEGDIINKIQKCDGLVDGLIINPGGYAHTSVAIRDSLSELKIPKIEVHLSQLLNREEFRQILLTASACDGFISGFKHLGYSAAVFLLLKILQIK